MPVRRIQWMVCASLAWACALGAQSATIAGRAYVRGDSTRGVPEVEVTLDRLDRAVRTDALGRFTFGAVTPGSHFLRARRLGFESVVEKFTISDGQPLQIRLAMRPSAQPMATMLVAGKRLDYPARLAEPYPRLARATGHYFTREQIDSLFPLDLQSLLMRVPGVRVTDRRSLAFVRCRLEGHIQVWVDGTRRTSYSSGRTEFDRDASDVLRDIPPSSVQLLEIYVGPSRIPAEFLDDACAVIAIWRK